MFRLRPLVSAFIQIVVILGLLGSASGQDAPLAQWGGVLRSTSGAPLAGAEVHLVGGHGEVAATTQPDGSFNFALLPQGNYQLVVIIGGKSHDAPQPLVLAPGSPNVVLDLPENGTVAVTFVKQQTGGVTVATGGEQLSSKKVSSIPLNKRDFSQLLLMAAGTMTDSNGASNFTQQFAINGQRGVEAVFAMDGSETSDPEQGGATFSNFNVDADQEIRSSSGWMPAEIGSGAAGYTNIITRSGTDGFHGSIFEFLRNSALDARNYFDHPSLAYPGRIPPFRRNEFGFTNGGPVILPGVYDGRGKTFYFGEYQGFRQVLGTTQVLPVPTAEQRTGLDTTAFPGDTLLITPDPKIAAILARYPMPNNPTGSYGGNTYATASKVVTNANQFSIRLDQKISDKAQLTGRFSWDNLTGPTTNPDQTAIDPSFGIVYVDHQRNGVVTYTRTVSPRFAFESSLSFTRSTPQFPTPNHTDAAVKFNDGLFEGFNTAGGSVTTEYGNMPQGRQTFTLTMGKHVVKFGALVRLNRDTTYFGTSPNGEYDFGGGTAYSLVDIPSQSGLHDIHVGDPLPDTLSAFLTGSSFIYTVAVPAPYASGGIHIGPAAISRNSTAVFGQDTWKINDRLVLDYGLRYEVYSPISERARRTSGFIETPTSSGISQSYVVNPQPRYRFNWNGFGPRVQLGWRVTDKLQAHIGGGITTIPPNIWQDNFLTGAVPFVIYPRLTATSRAPIQYGFQITESQLPIPYTPSGQEIFPTGKTNTVAPNTVFDVDRYQHDLAALVPGAQVTPLQLTGIDRHFGNGYLQTWTLGVERKFADLTADAAYVGTAAVHLPRITFPNAYSGASPGFAPFSQFDSAGNFIGGFGVEQVINDTSHSTYHALQTSLQGTVRGGLSVQASYTWSKSIDDVSTVVGGTGGTGAVAANAPQDPFNTHLEKGPSTFDVTHAFSMNLIQELHLENLEFLQPVTRKVTAGWEVLNVSTITSGSPFTIYSGIQQTGFGSNGVDRPDQVGIPQLSTARKVREDYFGRGADNASYFYIPIGIPGGSGPNQGRFGTLGRDTFRGPAYYDFDFALIKDTAVGTRSSGGELFNVQFRAEFFNLFNIVDMGLPANTIKGSGFGYISKTAGTSRQIQFSLKILY